MRRVAFSVKKLKDDDFIKNNAIYWTASLCISFINYLYYPVLGHIMKPADFGETQTIISIFTQAAIFFQVLSLVGIGIITKYTSDSERTSITNELSRLALFCSFVLLVCTIIFSGAMERFFHFSSISPFYALACSLMVSVPLSFANSYLQGHKNFWKLSVGNLLGSISKIFFSVLFVLLGLCAFGAVGGLVCAQILALIYALKMGKGLRHFVAANLHFRKIQLEIIKPELPYAGMVLATALGTNLLLSFDILVVKHYFSPKEAGLYTGISIISNIIFYVTGSLAAVLIPSITVSKPAAENFRVLMRSLRLVLGIGGLTTIVFILVPHLIVAILLGQRYAVYSSYLRGLSVAIFAMSIANLLIYYHIGLRHFLVAPVVLLGLFLTLALLEHTHATMADVVHDLVLGALSLLVLLIGMSFRYGLGNAYE